jgi:hypothetical protein
MDYLIVQEEDMLLLNIGIESTLWFATILLPQWIRDLHSANTYYRQGNKTSGWF